MATINTRISTNKDASIDALMITEGHPMIPGYLLQLAANPYGTIFKTNNQFLTYKGNFKMTHAGFYGIYGPAWAARADVQATVSSDGNAIEMAVTDDALKAGIQWGASHTFQLSFSGEEWKFNRWVWEPAWWGGYWWPEYTWQKNNSFNFVVPIDFIDLIYKAIQFIKDRKDEKEAAELEKKRQSLYRDVIEPGRALNLPSGLPHELPEPPLAEISKTDMLLPTLWGLIDEAGNTFNKTGWSLEGNASVSVSNTSLGGKTFHNGEYMEMKAYPGLVQAIDIWQILVIADKNYKQFSGSVEAFDAVFKRFWSDLAIGINLGILFPFHVKLSNILFNNAVYGDLTFDSVNSVVNGIKKDIAPSMPTYDAATADSDIELYFKFGTGIDFRLGFFASLTLLKIISFGFAVDWNIFEDWFHWNPKLEEKGVYIGGSAGYSAVAQTTGNDIEVVFA